MKRRYGRLEEDGEEPPVELVRGQYAAPGGEEDEVEWRACAVLWLPDPEQRRGWREYYIAQPQRAPLAPRRIGFENGD